MVYLYDTAIIEKLRTITNDGRVTITPFEEAIRVIAKKTEDTVELPLITIHRTGWGLLDSRPHTMKFDGLLSSIKVNADTQNPETVTNVQALPIRINYVMDVFTRTRLQNDNLLRELIFYFSTHPTLKINVPYGLDDDKNFSIFFENEVEDNSDIINHKNIGEHFRQSISFYTNDAYLWKASVRGKTGIDIDGLYLEVNQTYREKIVGV